MYKSKVMNRWFVVAGAILIQICLGAIYAWSTFTRQLTAAPYGFSRMETQFIFSAALLSLALSMALVAGKWQKRAGPRIVAITGGVILGLGYLIAGSAGASFWGILLGIGVVGGFGIGLAYVCPIVALVKWFPDKKGFITGLAVAGFGFGALIWIKLTQGFKFGPFNLTPGWDGLYGMGWNVSEVFALYGIIFALFVVLGSLLLVDPPEGWTPEGWDSAKASDAIDGGGVDFTAAEMFRTPQYWLLSLTFLVGAVSGLMVIGVIKMFGSDALAMEGINEAQVDLITGTAMGLFYALCNGLGRIAWGAISDSLGRKRSIILLSALQGVVMILFYFMGSTEWGLYLGAAAIGFNFGGNFALFPVVTADYFGNKNVGTNYPWIYLSYGLGGVLGPVLGGVMGDAQAWVWAFIPAGIACLAASLLCTRLTAPQKQLVPVAG